MVRLLVLLMMGIGSIAQASYRAYLLKVTHFDVRGRVERQRHVLSTLDHLQWEHVHGGYGSAKVELVDTWYCPGDTARRPICSKPRIAPTRGPASTLPKRAIPYERQPVIP